MDASKGAVLTANSVIGTTEAKLESVPKFKKAVVVGVAIAASVVSS
jgi:hypothetical protein